MPPGPQRPRPGRLDVPADRLAALLTDLGPSLRRGTALPALRGGEPVAVRACGLEGIDALIGGGFPADRLSEITGAASSGRTSVALSLLAHTTRSKGELAAVVDLADAFDPVSAEATGVDLDRILWVRTGSLHEALRAVERLLETEGIPVVILDSSEPSPMATGTRTPTRRRRTTRLRQEPRPPASAWTRLARLATGTRTTLLVLSDQRRTGAQAELVLEMRPAEPRFTGTPPLLEEIGLRAVLVRRRGGLLPGEATEDQDQSQNRKESGGPSPELLIESG